MAFIDFIKRFEPDKEKSPLLHTAYDAFFTFAYTPNTVTKGGVHVRDGMDLKRLMVHVVFALSLCYIFGTYNIGHQHFVASGQYLAFMDGFHLKLSYGLIKILPIFIVTHVVGLGIEFIFAAKRHHAVEEGFLVSGALIPLIMPADLPLWILAIAVAFAVILGKEAFGGTGMNIWNIALLARVFVFFAYPGEISGDQCWISGYDSIKAGTAADYGWWHTGFFNSLFSWMNLPLFDASKTVIVDGFSGATPLALAYQGGGELLASQYTMKQIFWGAIPGSIGETSKPLIIIGALFLIITKVASWRIMLSMLIGTALTGMLFNAWGFNAYMEIPWYHHIILGSFLFAMAFMATDPVTAAGTNRGKWVYGFLIGFIGMIIRVINPAYPEGWMLAILFINSFSSLIDYVIVQSNIKKRMSHV